MSIGFEPMLPLSRLRISNPTHYQTLPTHHNRSRRNRTHILRVGAVYNTIIPETYKYLFYLTRIFGLEPKHHFRDYYLFSGQMPCQLGLYSQFNGKSRIRTYGAFTPSGFQDQRFKPDSAILPYLYQYFCFVKKSG